jgi:hypothetical protein
MALPSTLWRETDHDSRDAWLGLGKNWVHMVGLDEGGRIVLRRRVRRDRLLVQTGNMPACLIGMEACCGAHHLARAASAGPHGAFDAATLREAVPVGNLIR